MTNQEDLIPESLLEIRRKDAQMDGLVFDIQGPNHLLHRALDIAMSDEHSNTAFKAVGYAPAGNNGLLLFRYEKDMTLSFVTPHDRKLLGNTLLDWLEVAESNSPPHMGDGGSEKGFRLRNRHPEYRTMPWEAFAIIEPVSLYYGK